MSHVALRRVMVRMLHDPLFTDAVYADPITALADVELTPTERATLTTPPRAAWSTAPDRPDRVRTALLHEFPVSAQRAPTRVADFFQSRAFHTAVQQRRSLAEAFAAHLSADAGPFATLEGAMARTRRAPRRLAPSPTGTLRLSPHAAILRVPAGTLSTYEALRTLTPPPEAMPGTEHVLIIHAPDTDDVTCEEAADGLASLLSAATTARPRAELIQLATSEGATPDEATSILQELEDAHLLI